MSSHILFRSYLPVLCYHISVILLLQPGIPFSSQSWVWCPPWFSLSSTSRSPSHTVHCLSIICSRCLLSTSSKHLLQTQDMLLWFFIPAPTLWTAALSEDSTPVSLWTSRFCFHGRCIRNHIVHLDFITNSLWCNLNLLMYLDIPCNNNFIAYILYKIIVTYIHVYILYKIYSLSEKVKTY